jgi:hypothetical protein
MFALNVGANRRTTLESQPSLWRKLLPVGSLLLTSLTLNFIGLSWGLPNGNDTWSTDALKPVTPLAATYRMFQSGWNSGWFYFKYPPGHSLILAAVYSPYLLWLWATGQIGTPKVDYPYGFADPEQSLFVLAMLGRGVSALMMTGATLLWYGTCREVLGPRGGWLAGWFFATLFPIVFYAHTTNVEAPLFFWTMLAFYGAARVYVRSEDRLGMVLLGAASAMALSTKEQALGILIWLPVMVLVRHIRRQHAEGKKIGLPAGTWSGLMVAGALFVVMNVIFFNPSGFWHRVQFLTHSLPDDLRRQYVPYYFPIIFEMPKHLDIELAHLHRTMEVVADSMGWPLLVVAILGCLVRGWRSAALFFIVPAVGYYFISGRSFLILTARYVLPLTVLATGMVALGIEWAGGLGERRKAARAIIGFSLSALVIYAGIRGVDAARLLVHDPRYAAEDWLQSNVPESATIETYQQRTYLPRFPSGVRVTEVPFEERSIDRFLARRPDFVVISSAGMGNVTTKYPRDWQQNDEETDEKMTLVQTASPKARVLEHKANRLFLDALANGCLEYVVAGRFQDRPGVAEPVIAGLAPTIEIYRRSTLDPIRVDRSDRCRALLRKETENGYTEGQNG